MELQILLKKGMGGIYFGCTPEIVRGTLGEPDEVEELESALDGDIESIVWYYPDAGLNFFFDAANGEPVLSAIESDNLETRLFDVKVFNHSKDSLVALMKEKGFNDLEEDDETWGEHRVTFDDAQVDFYFSDQELTLVSWSCY